MNRHTRFSIRFVCLHKHQYLLVTKFNMYSFKNHTSSLTSKEHSFPVITVSQVNSTLLSQKVFIEERQQLKYLFTFLAYIYEVYVSEIIFRGYKDEYDPHWSDR